MQRSHQLLFTVSLVLLSWLGMMAVHELGHVVGAVVTGGSVDRVVLYPLSISRTEVMPNPHPGVVVWLGPVIGCLLPLALVAVVPRRFGVLRTVSRFFAGFCLVANGAYILIGAFDRVGDCGEMLRSGTPMWAMFAFGTVTVPAGLLLWHRLGSLKKFINNPSIVTPTMALSAFSVLAVLLVGGFAFSPR